jgi:hypothetical protein
MKAHFIKNQLSRKTSLLAGAVAVALLAGCASSSNYQTGASAGAGLEDSASKINQGIAKIDATTIALNDLVNNPVNLADQFKKFSAAVSDLDAATKDVAAKVQAMRDKGNAYFAQWDKETAMINNEDIKNRSAARKAEMVQKFTDIKKSYVEAQDQFKPFLSDLKDIQTALSTDLTPGGIDAIKESANKVITEASSLKSTMTTLAGQFRDLGVAMSAAAPKPAPAEGQ